MQVIVDYVTSGVGAVLAPGPYVGCCSHCLLELMGLNVRAVLYLEVLCILLYHLHFVFVLVLQPSRLNALI